MSQPIEVQSVAEGETRARADFREARDTPREVYSVKGMLGNDSEEWGVRVGQPPIRVRVLATPLEDLISWYEGFLDPVWNVEIVEPHPAIPEGARSFWIYGPSYVLTKGGTP